MCEDRSRNTGGERTRRASLADAGSLIMSAAADGIVAVDAQGVIRLCNPAAEELFGRPAGELIGTPFGHPIVSGESTEIDLMRPDGRVLVVEMRATTTTVAGGRLHVASLRDVTRRRQVEEALRSELERRGAVIAVVAHEVRNPLATIALLVHMLRDPRQRLTEDERADILARIADRTEYLRALVKKLLTAAKIEARVSHAGVGSVPVLEVILERLAEFAERPGDVHVSCDPGVCVLADRGEFSEMVVNYLENAFTYGAPPIKVRVTEHPADVEIRVCDNGPGVPEDFVPSLFERFSREPGVEHKAEGSGLGLWIVRHLAKANGGEAYYEPAENGGACFCLRLPPATPS